MRFFVYFFVWSYILNKNIYIFIYNIKKNINVLYNEWNSKKKIFSVPYIELI